MRVYHFINAQYGLADLQEKRLKISRINDLNDPFEFTGADLSNLEFREAMGGLKDYLNEKWGLLCFSKSWDNPVQWTHYTDKHKGLCLGFDVPHPDWLLAEVNYEDERLSVDRFLAGINTLRDKVCAEKDDYTDQSASIEEARVKAQEFRKIVESEGFPVDPETDKEDREFMRKILSTKFSHWSYEKEYRIFWPLSEAKRYRDLYYFDFSDELRLKEVIIGVRSCVTTKNIKAALGGMAGSVDVFRVREAYREFAMVRDEKEASQV